MDPKKYVGCAPCQVEKFLETVVRPVLMKYQDEVNEKADISV
jgi:adenylosuccinate lyase